MDSIVAFIVAFIISAVTVVSNALFPSRLMSNVPIDEQLKDCLPKSDMVSKATCDRLLKTITNFDECVLAGFAVMETFPEQCRTSDERTFKKGSYSGKYVCLPHKDTKGPQTLECAFGLQAANGAYYALDFSSGMPESMTGSSIVVEGTMVPIEAISSDQWQKYNIKGIIRVLNISK